MPLSNPPAPECLILAGPNGAGKTSLYKRLALPGTFINADEVAKEIDPTQPERVSLEAGRRVLRAIDLVLSAAEDFVTRRR
jgi:predicted ABC-type ATPase